MRKPSTTRVKDFVMLNKNLMKLLVIFEHFPDWETIIIKPQLRRVRLIFNSDLQVRLSVSGVRKIR